jgi:hypothetical protein
MASSTFKSDPDGIDVETKTQIDHVIFFFIDTTDVETNGQSEIVQNLALSAIKTGLYLLHTPNISQLA